MSDQQFKSKLNITAVTLLWEVKNLWKSPNHGNMSTSFVILDQVLHLYIRRYDGKIAFYLCFSDSTQSVLRLLCEVSLVDDCGVEWFIGRRKLLTYNAKELVLLKKLTVSKSQKEIYQIFQNDDNLTISCKLSTSWKDYPKKCETAKDAPIMHFDTLSTDFERFYTTQQNPDAILKSDNDSFPVHRSILSARSSKFASMLNKNTTEDGCEVIDIKDIKPSILNEILYYIYTGKIRELIPETVTQLYAAAEILCLFELKDICQKFIQSNLTSTNILDVAVLVDKWDNEGLKEEVERFIAENTATVLQSDRWKEFSIENPVLANEILTTVLLEVQKEQSK